MNTISRGPVLAIALAAGMLLPAASSSPAEPALTDAHGNVDPSVAAADTPASRLYNARCASCHEHPQGRIPPRSSLRYSPPENVRHALVDGAMKPMTAGLSDADILSLVVFLTGSKPEVAADPMANRCATPAEEVVLSAGDWTSTHGDDSNSRFRGNTGVDVGAISSLQLKWSFAYPGRAAGPVTLGGNRVFLASSSHVVSLDAAGGCTRWVHPVDGRLVRSVSLATLPVAGAPGRAVLVFGDDSSTVTALDAGTGDVLWRTRVEEHVLSRITAAPSIHDGRVFAPISGIEDPLTHDPAHECCTSRGGVAALDLATGKLLWKQYHIAEEPTLRSGANETPRRFGPAGASTYTPLAIDAKRGVLYATTAEEYGFLDPRGPYSVIAYDLHSGARKWEQQFLPDASARELACTAAAQTDCRNLFSMGTSVTIVTLAGGKQVLTVGQKWGFVYGLDPDSNGEELWRTRVAQGGDLGGVMYGMATDGSALYVPVSDDEARPPHRPGGLAALDPASGAVLWRVAGPEPQCSWGAEGCKAAYVAAPSAVPGAVFTGAWDGHLRIYSGSDGSLMRDIDTGGEFEAVNGMTARGGQVSGYPVVVGNGAVYVTSGASSVLHPGNALLVYTPDGK